MTTASTESQQAPGRFCKTCRYLKADRSVPVSTCTFWVEFSKTLPMPFASLGGGQPSVAGERIVLPRHVWDDLQPQSSKDAGDPPWDPWSEIMDCETWEPRRD